MLVRVKNGKIGDIPNFDSLKLASLYHIDTVKDGNAFAMINLRTFVSNRNNFISYLPTELVNLPKLKSLDVQDNPLTSPPPEIVQQGLCIILDYLRKRKSRKNLFFNFKPWFSEDDSLVTKEIPSLFELCIK